MASRFGVLSRHRKRVYSVTVQKELMQFVCTTCFISYFMGVSRFIGQRKVRLCLTF